VGNAKAKAGQPLPKASVLTIEEVAAAAVSVVEAGAGLSCAGGAVCETLPPTTRAIEAVAAAAAGAVGAGVGVSGAGGAVFELPPKTLVNDAVAAAVAIAVEAGAGVSVAGGAAMCEMPASKKPCMLE